METLKNTIKELDNFVGRLDDQIIADPRQVAIKEVAKLLLRLLYDESYQITDCPSSYYDKVAETCGQFVYDEK